MLPSPDALLPVAPPLCGRCRAPRHRCTACASPAHAPPLRACPCSSAHCCWHCGCIVACKQPPMPALLCLLLEAVRACRCCRWRCCTHRHSRIVAGALTRMRPPRQVFLCSICAPWSSCCCAARASPACGHPAKGPGEIQTPSVSINRQRPRNQRDPPSANEILFPWCADPAP